MRTSGFHRIEDTRPINCTNHRGDCRDVVPQAFRNDGSYRRAPFVTAYKVFSRRGPPTYKTTVGLYFRNPRPPPKYVWKVVKHFVREPVGGTVQERPGIAQDPKKRMQELAIAFTIFHTVKHGEHNLYLEALRSRNDFPLATAVKSFAHTAAFFGRAC